MTRAKERIFLGESVFARGEIDEDTFARGVAAVRRLRELALEHAPSAVTAVATAAVREARNGRAFVRAIQQRSGIEVRIIDGLEEARLSLLGARRELGASFGRVALIDFGAGSTEIVVADPQRCHLTASLPFGALRLKARLGRVDILDRKQLARLEEQVAEDLGHAVAHLRIAARCSSAWASTLRAWCARACARVCSVITSHSAGCSRLSARRSQPELPARDKRARVRVGCAR